MRPVILLKVNSLISIFQNFRPKLPQVPFLGQTPSFVECLSLSTSGNWIGISNLEIIKTITNIDLNERICSNIK